MLSKLLLSFLVCFYLTNCLSGQSPIRLLQENPHYFEYKGKPVILITSAEHYGAVLNLDFDYKKYLGELASQNLNLTRTFSGEYCEPPGAFNIAKNTLAPLPGRFISPWARSTTSGYRNGGNKFDLTKWDEKYFERLKDFMTAAAEKNVIVEFTLFCPFYEDTMWIYSPLHPGNNVNNTPDIPRTDVYTLDKSKDLLPIQKKLVEKLVTELNEFDNLVIEICNEPYFGGVTMEWQHAMADVIVETEKQLPKKHLISQNIANATALIKDPHPAVSVFNFHYAYPPSAVQQNYHLNKLIGNNETGFRGTSDTTYRFEGWRFILAGGGLYNNLDYSFTAGNETGNFEYPKTQPGGGSNALRKQLKNLKEFMDGFEYWKMRPDSLLVDGAEGLRYNALTEPGKQYAMYVIGNMQAQLTLNVQDGRYKVQWLDPVTGKYSQAEMKTAKNNKLVLVVPKHDADIALKIQHN